MAPSYDHILGKPQQFLHNELYSRLHQLRGTQQSSKRSNCLPTSVMKRALESQYMAVRDFCLSLQ